MRNSLGLGAAILVLSALPVIAQPAIDGYQDYKAYRAAVTKLDESDLVSVAALGTTLGGHEILAVTVGTGKVDDKPAIAVVGNVHGPHLVGAELALRMARLLAEKAASDPEVAKLLERFTFYFLPRPTPDASEAFFHRPYVEREGNARWTDDDRDGEVGEDPPEDLNGDGWVTMMRVEDETGKFTPHPGDPRVMIEANPRENEHGGWTLYTEGTDNDGDRAFNEDGSDGVAFNRNFPFQYPFFQKGAGPHQVSEVESRAVADFLWDHKNIAIVISFTPEDNLMHPWQPNPQADGERVKNWLQGGDSPYFQFVAKAYQEAHGGTDAPNSPDGVGSFSEWAYFQYGRWSFAARGWWVPKVAPPEKKPEPEPPKPSATTFKPIKPDDGRGADVMNVLRWLEREKIDGCAAWTPIAHPDFPGKKVEVGGIKPFVTLNPPAKELDPLAEKHFAFLCKLAALMPEVKITDARVEKLGGGVFRLTATVVNDGYLPTMTAMGKITGAPFPLWISLELPKGAALLTGAARRRLDPLEGGGGKAETTWTFRVEGGLPTTVNLEVGSPSTGADRKSVGVE